MPYYVAHLYREMELLNAMNTAKLSLTAFLLSHLVMLSMSMPVCAQFFNSESLRANGIVSASINDIFSQSPNNKVFDVNASDIPVDYYSFGQRETLKRLNAETTASIMVDVDQNDSLDWTLIDREEITPLSWVWVDLLQVHSVNDSTFISLRRPTWWLKQHHIHEPGEQIVLEIPEVGIMGPALVRRIRSNILDTRLLMNDNLSSVVRPITGKFTHLSNNVYDVYFENQSETIGVTGSHPFWSVDRNTWIRAAALLIGERVKTQNNTIVVTGRKKRSGSHKVYNLEVYRTHNYFVSTGKILVHNVCVLDYLKSKVKKMVFGKRYVLFGDKYGDILLENSANNHMQRPGFGVGAVQGFGMTDKTVVQALDKALEQGGEILFILDGVDIDSAKRGFNDFLKDASETRKITEWELSLILRNKRYYDNTKVTINGEVVPISHVKGMEYIGSK